ncbi:glycosyltransferase family 1 protein [Pleomorphochaeta sp. DL1XJH-081]|uniref:glycosyltransferase family 1 protein n=1 Tax=Pleomorphochaeta sp. DL1XJH-081 TaxID=3409690 RepID=UPI003BB6BD86
MGNPIRILHVLGGLDLGGAETIVMNLYRNIDREKVQFDFVVHTQNKCFYEDEIGLLGGNIYRVPRFTGFNLLKYWNSWKILFRGNASFVAVHGHLGSSAAIYLKVAKSYGLYSIAHSHGAGNSRDFKGFMYGFFSFPTRYVADYFFACSLPAGISRFGRRIVDSTNFSILKNAIQIQKFVFTPSIRGKYRADLDLTNQFVVGHVGRFDPLKNHPFLLKVFKEVHDRIPNSKLLLVGDGEERQVIEEIIKKYNLKEHVILLGSRADVSGLLHAMDVFLFPSYAEGLGISLVEAQTTGLPCVVSSNVPREVEITDLIEFLSLDESIERWCETIVKMKSDISRRDHSQEVEEKGYGILGSAQQIQAFYLNNTSERKKESKV